MHDPRPARLPVLLAALALVCLVLGVFFPILGFKFVDYDVPEQVLENRHIQGLTGENLKHIFTSWCIRSYYPVRTVSFALDYQLWGLEPAGFKLTNILIHVANVLLVLWLILRLLRRSTALGAPAKAWRDSAVATFGAGIFAVHPVVVETVTWVAGREELLMVLGTLGCIHFHLTARWLSEEGGKPRRILACHVSAALCCAAACLSNAVAAVIPLLIVAWDVLTLTRPKLWKIVYGTSALWVIGATTVAIKKLSFKRSLGVGEPEALSVERVLYVLKVYWLNLKTLLWPTDLAVAYMDLPPESPLDGEVVLGGLAVALTCAALWVLRRNRMVLFGLLWFGLALAPSLQIMRHHWPRADRFMYLPLVGLAVAAALGLRALGNRWKRRLALTGVLALGVWALLTLVFLSRGQVQTWQNSLCLWDHCVRVAPNHPSAQRNLADNLVKAGRFDLAIPRFEEAIRLDPRNEEALNNYALQLATGENLELRDYGLAVELATRGCEVTEWKNSKLLRTLAMACTNLAVELGDGGEFSRAIQCYDQAIRADPEYKEPRFNLALLLATCPDEKLRRPGDAVRLAEQACALAEQPDSNGFAILATAYGEAGRFDEAIAAIDKARELPQAAGDPEFTDKLRRQRKLYQDRNLNRNPH